MTAEEVEAICLSLPGAHKVVQWMDSKVYKLNKKVFAVVTPDGKYVTLKCETIETADMLISAGAAAAAHHLPRGGWVTIDLSSMPTSELHERLTRSYSVVRSGLPKTQRDALNNV